MSLLLVDPPARVGVAVVDHLVAEGDEVRVLIQDKASGAAWRSRGAFVATGDADDEDLVERACQNVRTVVVFGPPTAALVAGSRAAGAGRVITITGTAIPRVDALEHVRLVTRGRTWWSRSRCSDEDVAIAVSAADDLVAVPVEPVFLTEPAGRRALKLEPA